MCCPQKFVKQETEEEESESISDSESSEDDEGSDESEEDAIHVDLSLCPTHCSEEIFREVQLIIIRKK